MKVSWDDSSQYMESHKKKLPPLVSAQATESHAGIALGAAKQLPSSVRKVMVPLLST